MWWYWNLGLYPQGNWLWPGDRYEDQFDGVFYGATAKTGQWWFEVDKQVKAMYTYGLTPHGLYHNQVLKNYNNSGVVAYYGHKNPAWDDNPMDPYGIDPHRWWFGGPRIVMRVIDSKKIIPQLPLWVYGEMIIRPAKSYTPDGYNHYNYYGRHKDRPRQTWSPLQTLYLSRFHKTNWPYWKVFHSYLWTYHRSHTTHTYRDIVNGTWPWRWWWNSYRRRAIDMKAMQKSSYSKGGIVYKFRAMYRQWADWHNYAFFFYQDNFGDL